MTSIRIATRNSPLALWQASYIEQRLLEVHPGLVVEIVSMTTKGDQLLDRSLAAVGGKGLFLKELELSLLDKQTDIAVHSMKDVPANLPDGLEIAAVCDREDPRDAFVSNNYQNLYALPKGSKVGTSSLRRVAQLKHSFPDLEFVELRGNVNTRLSKLDNDEFDGIILAAAGLIRLNFTDRIKQYITPELCLPAVGQGIVGIECRSDDEETKRLIAPLNSQTSALVIAAERSMSADLEGGCQLPVAGFAEIVKGKIRLRGLVGEVDGSICLQSEDFAENMTIEKAVELGRNTAEDLLEQGANQILSSIVDKVNQKTSLEFPVVVLTREEKYLGNTPTLLETLDYQPVHIEALELEPNFDQEVLDLFSNIEKFTDILFISRNAVDIAMPMLKDQSELLESVRVMAVGSETAKQLFQHGIDALFPDTGHGAQALLNVQQLHDLTGRKILIVRGEHGLDWPAQEMENRGAEVVSAMCYQQMEPLALKSQLDNLFSSARSSAIQGIFVHSSMSAKNIISNVIKHPGLTDYVKLIVGSEVIAKTAIECGWRNEIRVARSPSNKHMMIAFSREQNS